MSFYDVYSKYKDFDLEQFNEDITDYDIERVINKGKLDDLDFLTLIFTKDEKKLE